MKPLALCLMLGMLSWAATKPMKACKSLDQIRIDGRCWYRVEMESALDLATGMVSRVKVPDSWLIPQGAKGNICPKGYDYQHMESTTFSYSRCIPKELQ